MIIPVSLAVVAISLGYAVVVCLLLGLTLGLTSAAPHFVETEHRLRSKYKLAQAGVWLLCTAAGAFATAWIGDRGWAWLEGLALVAVLTTVLWKNPWESRQRGLAHQILLTLLTPIGVSAGYMMRF